MSAKKGGLSIGAALRGRMEAGEAEGQAAPTAAPTPQVQPAPEAVDPLEPFNTRLRKSLQKRLKLFAVQHDTSIQEVMNAALADHLDRHGG